LTLLDGGRLRPRQKLQLRSGTLEYLLRRRDGGPTLVLVNGAGVGLKGWSALFPAIESLGTVLAYNRFGVGGSDRPTTRQTGGAIVASLRELLTAVGLTPPYLLVGHSLGGLHANLFARLHPDEVRACLLLEATHPKDRAVLREHEGQLLKALSHLLHRPQERFRANVHSELKWIDETAAQIEAAGPFPAIPLTVISGGRAPPSWLLSPVALQARRRHQHELAGLSPLGTQVIAQRSGHFPQLSEPQLVLAGIERLVQASEFSSACPPP
jgi:pimeloyl-ACP methyl ester carboxylesterase